MVRSLVIYDAFFDELVKIAAAAELSGTTQGGEGPQRDHFQTAVGLGTAGVGAGTALHPTTRGRMLGYKRMYHGTGVPEAESIRQGGLKTQYGGTGVAAVDLAMGREAAEASKDRVYLTGRKSSAAHYAGATPARRYLEDKGYSLDEASQMGFAGSPIDPADEAGAVQAYKRGARSGKGRVKVDLPYEMYQRAEADPLVKKMIDAAPQVKPPDYKHEASILAEDVAPKYIHGGKGRVREAIRRLSDVPSYIRKNPGRFGKGLLGLGVGTGVTAGGLLYARDGWTGGSPEKTAAEEEKPGMLAPAAAVAGGGALMASPSARGAALGYKRVYHGTGEEAARSIKEQGLLAQMGGGPAGAGAVAAEGSTFGKNTGQRFMDHSRGKVHVTGAKPVAGQFAKFVGKGTGQRPEVLKADLPMDMWQKFDPDPDMIGNPDLNDSLTKYVAATTTDDIDSRFIHGGKGFSRLGLLKDRLADLPGYVAKHPKRFLGGVGVVGLGATGVGWGGKKIYDRFSGGE